MSASRLVDLLQKRRWPALLASITLLGLILRLWQITYHSLWFDEAVSAFWARQPVSEIVQASFYLVKDKHPPAYYLLLHYWTLLFGDSEVALRLLSVFFGMLVPPALAGLGAELFDRRTGLIAGLFGALNPILVWYSQEARMFMPATALTLLASWCLVRGLRRPRLRCWAAYALLMLLALYSYLFSAFVLAFHAVYVLAWLVGKWRRGEMAKSRRGVLSALLSMALVGLLFLPLFLNALQVTGHEAQPGRPFHNALSTLWGMAGWYAVWRPAWPADVMNGVRALASILLLLGLLVPSARKEGRTFLWSAILVPLLAGNLMLGLNASVFAEPRYFLFIVPFLCLAWAQAVGWISRQGRALGWAALVLWSAVMVTALPDLWAPANRREDWRAAVAYVEEHAGPNDAVVIHPGFVHLAYAYYAERDIPLFFPFEGDITSEEQIDAPLQGIASLYDVVWLITSHDDQPDPQHLVQRWFAARFPLVTEQFPAGVAVRGYITHYRLETLPPDVPPLGAAFANGLFLEGYRVDHAQLSPRDDTYHPPSNWVHVTLYWKAAGPLPADFDVELKMVDTVGQVWGDRLYHAGDTLRLFPPTRWSAGEIIRHDVDVNLNPATPAGSYRLVLRVVGPNGEPWPALEGAKTSIETIPIADILILP